MPLIASQRAAALLRAWVSECDNFQKEGSEDPAYVVKRKLLPQILGATSLKEVLKMTPLGTCMLMSTGDLPKGTKVPTDPQFTVTTGRGKSENVNLPLPWQRILSELYAYGVEKVPFLGSNTSVRNLDLILSTEGTAQSTGTDQPKGDKLLTENNQQIFASLMRPFAGDRPGNANVPTTARAIPVAALQGMASEYARLPPPLPGQSYGLGPPERAAVPGEYGILPGLKMDNAYGEAPAERVLAEEVLDETDPNASSSSSSTSSAAGDHDVPNRGGGEESAPPGGEHPGGPV